MTKYKSYLIGFLASIVLTLAAFVPVFMHAANQQTFSSGALTVYILILAMIQLCVQLFLFLHLGKEKKPRWNFTVFLMAISLVLVVIVGSLWIMAHLNYNMTPQQIQNYISNNDAF